MEYVNTLRAEEPSSGKKCTDRGSRKWSRSVDGSECDVAGARVRVSEGSSEWEDGKGEELESGNGNMNM